MRLRWLPLFPLFYAAAFLVLAHAFQGGEALAPFLFWQRILVRVLAAAGCFAAVSCFEPGEHLRRAWFWLGAGTVVILIRDLLRLAPAFDPQSAGPGAQSLVTGLGILSNLALLAGVWMLARSWKMAAITLPGGRSGVGAVAVVTAALALLVAGPGALQHLRELSQGDWSALVLVVSAGVDILTLCLITPLLLTAVSMRGGLFSWPWALVTTSQLSWILYDFAAGLKPGVLPAGLPLAEVGRGLAENYLFAAGMAQYLVIRQVRRAAASLPAAEPAPSAAVS
ncbi:MAG TPA: hypothetical protein VHC97_02765 [Thermoanaerobaculia bacterium]|jgi:hypothetical protein|nr:hypothetical protein [Thermoanaerobaculia bacterium]